MDMVQIAQQIIDGRNLGRDFAKRIRVGKKYFGPMPIAKKIYKNLNSAEATAFIFGYINFIDNSEIFINPDSGLISGFTDKTGKLKLSLK